MFKKHPKDIQPDWYNTVNIYNIGLTDLNNSRFPFLSCVLFKLSEETENGFQKNWPL